MGKELRRGNGKIKNIDKSTIRLSRHSSFTINHTFVNPSKTGHNMAEELNDITDLTTKGQG